jgi:predicted DNA-binding transcriptional regulator YafY
VNLVSRDQQGPLARLVRLLTVMNSAGVAGVTQAALIKAVGFTGELDSQRRQLAVDINELNSVGWDIQHVSAGGKPRYVLRSRDTRLRVELAREERAELSRAVRMAGAGNETSMGVTLLECLRAVAQSSVLRFTYDGTPRSIHPRRVQPGPSGWYLVGRDDWQDVDRYFVVDRIQDVTPDRPGTCIADKPVHRNHVDPATWEVDPPVEVSIETAPDFAEQVERVLGPALTRRSRDDRLVLVFGVTNRAVFRMRIYPLGTRVRVLGPGEVRDEIVAELTEFAGA